MDECERMVQGLEYIYSEQKFDLIEFDEKEISIDEKGKMKRKRCDFEGFELIDFKTEKIIGALDFIQKIMEYNAIVPTEKYIQRISDINKKFIPNVHIAREKEQVELKKTLEEYKKFCTEIELDKLIKLNKLYEKEKTEHKHRYKKLCMEERHKKNSAKLGAALKTTTYYKEKRDLHINNIKKLDNFIAKYNKWDKKETCL